MFRVFLTNLGKYNEGELVGKWIDLPISDEELKNVLDEIGINERYEETFITDYENDYDYRVDEYDSIEELNEFAEKVESLDEYDKKVFEAANEVFGDVDIEDFDPDDYRLYEGVKDYEDIARDYIDGLGGLGQLSKMDRVNYFDFAEFGNMVSMEFDPWGQLDVDPDDEEEIAEYCEQYDVESIDDIDAYKYYDVDNDYDLGWECTEGGYIDMVNNPEYYFDYESFGEAIYSESDSGFSKYGWIEQV